MARNWLYTHSTHIALSVMLLIPAGAVVADTTSTDKVPVINLAEDESVEDIEASEPRHRQNGSDTSPTQPESTPPPAPADSTSSEAEPASGADSQPPKVVAPNVDLKEVAPAPDAAAPPTEAEPETAEPTAGPGEQAETTGQPPSTAKTESTRPESAGRTFTLLNADVRPGTSTRLAWSPGIQIAGLSQPTPVLVVNGAQSGPALCLTGAIHGDELNGIEVVRRVMYDLDPKKLSGTVIGIPIVNVQGFQQGSRYLADRRDLNRYFPGDPAGSLAGRIAHSLFEQVIRHCDMLVDIHTGSLKRTNLPQMRADMNVPEVAEFTRGFDGMAIVHSSGGPGMLRTAAVNAGIVTVTMEAGESLRIQESQIDAGVNSINSLMEKQNMLARFFVWGDPEPIYYDSHWIRVDHGGILFSDVSLGDKVQEGQALGVVADPITNEQFAVRADADGRVIGMAVDQVVMAGFAAYHIGLKAETPGEE